MKNYTAQMSILLRLRNSINITKIKDDQIIYHSNWSILRVKWVLLK